MYFSKAIRFALMIGLAFVQQCTTRECDSKHELPCGNGECVKNEEWCNSKLDCSDGSDEYSCSGPCDSTRFFQCKNNLCVPQWAVCNDYDNCGDGSDEFCRDAERLELNKSLSRTKRRVTDPLAKAAEYLLSKRNSEYGWDTFTPRAIVALTFAEKVFYIPEHEKTLMKKHLNIQILLSLMRNNGYPNLIDLALHINALYATCQNPRNFNQMDLVDLLQSETDNEIKGDFNLPLVLMTLCIADRGNYAYVEKLISMYDDLRNDRLSFKALTVMAMTACRSRASSMQIQTMNIKMEDFSSAFSSQDGSADIYSEALSHQALIALGRSAKHSMEIHQLPDGSFGDLLSTYYAIPVLLNDSLLHLKCNGTQYDETGMALSKYRNGPKKMIVYSLWISQDSDVDCHTMSITLEGNESLYDAMMLAKSRDPMFRFMYDVTSAGKVVYSMGGLPNDAETGMSWVLYLGDGSSCTTSEYSLKEITSGIERIFPEDGDHFIFWRKLNLV